MTRSLRAASLALVAASVLAFASTAAQAQKPAGKPMCATLLTADELAKAVVAGFQDMGADEREAGESSCPWMLRGGKDGFKTVNVQFYTLAAVKTSPMAPTAEKFFEMLVKAAEESNNKKRETLPGIGVAAAFVAADPQVAAFVQRADGVARIVGNNLTKAHITAVAKAVVTP